MRRKHSQQPAFNPPRPIESVEMIVESKFQPEPSRLLTNQPISCTQKRSNESHPEIQNTQYAIAHMENLFSAGKCEQPGTWVGWDGNVQAFAHRKGGPRTSACPYKPSATWQPTPRCCHVANRYFARHPSSKVPLVPNTRMN